MSDTLEKLENIHSYLGRASLRLVTALARRRFTRAQLEASLADLERARDALVRLLKELKQ